MPPLDQAAQISTDLALPASTTQRQPKTRQDHVQGPQEHPLRQCAATKSHAKNAAIPAHANWIKPNRAVRSSKHSDAATEHEAATPRRVHAPPAATSNGRQRRRKTPTERQG